MTDRTGRREVLVAALAATLLLGACETIGLPAASIPPADPEVGRLNEAIGGRASTLYVGLPAKTAPDCAFPANEAAYGAMRADAGALEQRVAAGPGDRVMTNAARSLATAVTAAEDTHRLASANTGDRFGACMAPGTITLNAGAIARATEAIANLQRERSR